MSENQNRAPENQNSATENQNSPPGTDDGTGAAKDPDAWVTGDEPATASQVSYLHTLAQDNGTDVPEQLTKADASKLIDELQGKSPRVSDS